MLPACSVITPNAREASVLIGRPVENVDDLENAARELAAQYGCAVVVKGGHVQGDSVTDVLATPKTTTRLVNRRNFSVGDNDASGGAHGTGCVLSSALAARLALGDNVLDAVVAAKALCAEAIACAHSVGNGPPVASPPQIWPSTYSAAFVPGIPFKLRDTTLTFPPLDGPPMRLYALADSADRAVALFKAGVHDVQLRIKSSRDQLRAATDVSVQAALACGARLWINDDWELAAEAGAFGVHLGQEDLYAVQDLDALARSGLRLGVSTHCLSELAVATYLRPSYVALGPIYGTTSKQISFDARGTSMIADWRKLVPRSAPLIAIGGINLRNAPDVLAAGADSIAVISVRISLSRTKTGVFDYCAPLRPSRHTRAPTLPLPSKHGVNYLGRHLRFHSRSMRANAANPSTNDGRGYVPVACVGSISPVRWADAE